MAKANRPVGKPTVDDMTPRRSGQSGWQLNLRERLPDQVPPHVIDLRNKSRSKQERFFEYLPIDGFVTREIRTEEELEGEEELDIDEKLMAWWQNAKLTLRELFKRWAAQAAAAWTWLGRHLPGRHSLGVILAVALLAGLVGAVIAVESPHPAAGQGVKNPPGPVVQPAPAPILAPATPVPVPAVQPLTQPVQQLAQPVTGGLGL